MLKEQTRENYNDRLNRVFDYVHAHLEDDVSFDRLARSLAFLPITGAGSTRPCAEKPSPRRSAG